MNRYRKKISFIYMASGFGSRFGANKLLVPLEGKALYLHGLHCLRKAAGELRAADGYEVEIIVVSQYKEILESAKELGARSLYNSQSGEGIAASLRLGTGLAPEDTDIYMFFVADQPYMSPSTVVHFLRGFDRCGLGMGCVSFQGKNGNPAAFAARYKEELLRLRGDKGGRVIMRAHPSDVWTMEAARHELKDIDERTDLEESGTVI